MSEMLWKLPVPASAVLSGPFFAQLPKRQCELSFYVESADAETEQQITLRFEDVEAYKCTHLASCTAEMFNTAYGELVQLGATPWLSEIATISGEYHAHRRQPAKALQHLMICFDDGPCYEIICVSFKVALAAGSRTIEL